MESKNKRIICYGDSNTYGFDPRSFMGGRYEKENRWTGILEKTLNYDIINMGQNGREVPVNQSGIQALQRIFVRSLKACETQLIIMLGVNDILCGRSAEETGKRMNSFLQELLAGSEALLDNLPEDKTEIKAGYSERQENFMAAYKGLPEKIILIAPPGITQGAWVDDLNYITQTIELGDYYRQISQKTGINFIDARSWNIDVTFDGVHFSKDGNAEFASRIRQFL